MKSTSGNTKQASPQNRTCDTDTREHCRAASLGSAANTGNDKTENRDQQADHYQTGIAPASFGVDRSDYLVTFVHRPCLGSIERAGKHLDRVRLTGFSKALHRPSSLFHDYSFGFLTMPVSRYSPIRRVYG